MCRYKQLLRRNTGRKRERDKRADDAELDDAVLGKAGGAGSKAPGAKDPKSKPYDHNLARSAWTARFLAKELTLKTGVVVNAVGRCGNAQATYVEVLGMAKKAVYSANADYNDMVMQFGYVTMFSIIWPWIPLCAIFNNFFETRGDLYGLLHANTRTIPRKANGIGVWKATLYFIALQSVTVNVLLACYSTGYIEAFTSCDKGADYNQASLGPIADCFMATGEAVQGQTGALVSGYTSRSFIAFVCIHLGLACHALVFLQLSPQPWWVKERLLLLQKASRDELEKVTGQPPPLSVYIQLSIFLYLSFALAL